MSRLDKAVKATRDNDPPIEVNQIWTAYNEGVCNRRIRILAPYPESPEDGFVESDKRWIIQNMRGAKMGRAGDISICPELNLRYVFNLGEKDESSI